MDSKQLDLLAVNTVRMLSVMQCKEKFRAPRPDQESVLPKEVRQHVPVGVASTFDWERSQDWTATIGLAHLRRQAKSWNALASRSSV